MNEWFEKIEQYLNGHMSQEERLHFESEVAINNELYALLIVYKEIETEMRHSEKYSADEAALKGTLEKLNAVYFNNGGVNNKTVPGEKPAVAVNNHIAFNEGPAIQPSHIAHAGIKKINRWIPAVAAAVLGIVSLGVLWFFNHQQSNRLVAVNNKNAGTSHQNAADTSSPNLNAGITGIAKPDSQKLHTGESKNHILNNVRRRQLFAANFKPDALPADVPPSLQEPMADYEAARHRDALEGFDAANPEMATRGMEEGTNTLVPFYIHYYKAQSLLATNHAAMAIAELHMAMRKSPDSFFSSKVNWYLALANLNSGNIKKAEQLLQQLSANSTAGQYQRKAAELLKVIVK